MATLDQIEAALRAADAAGNVEDARRLAQAYAQARGAQAASPSFAGVQSSADVVPGAAPPQAPGYFAQRGKELRGMGEGLRYSAAETALGLGQMLGGADDSDVARFRAKKAAAEQEYGKAFEGGNTVGALGQTLLPVGAIGKGSKALQYGRAALAGGAFGAAKPTLGGESRFQNTLVGAGLNVGGLGASNALLALGKKAAPGVRDLYQTAKAQGINLSPAQLSQSPFFQRFVHMTDRLPFSGAPARAEAQQAAGNRAVAGLLGQKADVVDTSVIAQAADDIGQQFDAVMANGMKYDRRFLRDVASLQRSAQDLDDSAGRVAGNFAARVRRAGKGGQLSGKALQSLDMQARKAAESSTDGAKVASGFREALHDAFERQAPAKQKAVWDQARRQWATLKAVEPLVSRNPEGGIPMQQLQGAINTTKRGRTRRARGRDGDLGVLATVGQRMRGPNTSGSAENLQAAGMGYGLVRQPVSTAASLLGGAVASRALNSRVLAGLLMNPDRGRFLTPLAPYTRPLPFGIGWPAYAGEPERP